PLANNLTVIGKNILISFFFQAEDGIRAGHVTGVQTCALPISRAEGLLRPLDASLKSRLDKAVEGAKQALRSGNADEISRALDERSEERRVGKESRFRRSGEVSRKETIDEEEVMDALKVRVGEL